MEEFPLDLHQHPHSITALLLSATVFLIQLAVAIHALINKREEATSALLWLVIIFTFPGIGIILYLLCGINRIQTLGVKVRLANQLINTGKDANGKPVLAEYIAEQQRYTCRTSESASTQPDFSRTLDRLLPNTVPLGGNHLELLRDGNAAYSRMLEEIEKAKSTIHLQSYIIMNDDIAERIFNVLEQKATEGVKVKVLYDKVGSAYALYSRFFRPYAQQMTNFEIRPFAHSNLFAPWLMQLRNHRKLLVVDGKAAFVGGINISSSNIAPRFYRSDRYIHDLHCRVQGPAVADLQFSFLRDWCYATKLNPENVFSKDCFPIPQLCGDSAVRVVDSGPGQSDKAAENVFFTAATTARKYIWLMTPYFVPERAFIKALVMAVARGVEVRIIVPASNNHWYVHYATRSLYSSMLTSGVRVFEKAGSFCHAKAMLVDGEWGVMGSSNCDVRSFRLNYELDIIVSQGSFMNELHEQFISEMRDCHEINVADMLNKPLHVEITEDLCSLLTPLL